MRGLLPSDWHARRGGILPEGPSVYEGPALPVWAVYLFLSLITVRSCIHVFLPDGGAHSIATIDISVAGGANIVAMFGQWGAIQLLLVGLMWVLVLRYRGFVPLVLCTLITEPFLRSLAGHLKPVITVHTAPGAALNFVFLPVLGVLLWMSLCRGRSA
jgi:hypothetical protein